MFEQWTEEARRVVFYGFLKARECGAESIMPEHLLLGMLRENAPLMQNLSVYQAVDIEHLRERIVDLLPEAGEASFVSGLPLSPAAKRILEQAKDARARLKQENVMPEHVLLALINTGSYIPIRNVLAEFGFSAEEVERRLSRTNTGS